jgi:hypothetical protein
MPSPAFVNAITPGGSGKITFYRYWPGSSGMDARWYVMQNSGSTTSTNFFVYDAKDNNLLNNFSISLPTALQGASIVNSFALDPAGDVYVGTYAQRSDGGSVSQWLWTPGHTSATEGWSAFTPGLLVGGIYGYTDSNGVYRVAAVTGNPTASDTHIEAYSDTYNASTGLSMGTNNIIGSDIENADAHNGDLIAVDTNVSDPTDNSIAIWNATGTTESFFMSAGVSPASSWTAKPSGANELANGDIIMTSYVTRQVALFSPVGLLLGTIGADVAQPLDTIDDARPVEVENNNIYYVAENPFSAPNKLTYFTTATASAHVASPLAAPIHLGLGAGLNTSATDNYFPPGSTPSVNLQFNQWWQPFGPDYTGRYTVLNINQALNQNPGASQSFTIPSSVSDYAAQTANVPLTLPTDTPGVYQVNAELLQGGAVVGADTLVYTVGAVGDTFNPASIPAGADASGVYLANQFGQKLYRSSYTIDSCYPGITTPTTATTLNCPSGLVADIASSASLAAKDGLTYEIQLGTGTAFDQAAVSENGVWQHLVKQMATQFPEVTYWECWNEPDNNTFKSASQYVTEALEPCYSAVKGVSQADKVIGISNDGYSVGNYKNYVSAGALNYLDIVAVHPYTGFNESWAKQGMVNPSVYSSQVGQMQALQSYLTSAGYHGPLFDTESGFWNSTPSDPSTYYEQGDKLVTKYILEKSIGMDWVNNFYDDGAYTVNGLYWGLLGGADKVLNPGGLAVINYAATLGERSFLSWIPTGVSDTYAALFGPSATDSNDVVALWADDANADVLPMLSSGAQLQMTSEYGATSAVANAAPLELTGQVDYINVPSGQTLTIGGRHQTRRPLNPALIKTPVGAR